MNDEEKKCGNCQRLLDVKKAQSEGAGMFELAMGPGLKCASCSRNPGIGISLGLMKALGKEPEDNWTPVEGAPTC